ncbi:hypothetical protein GW17_00009391 [Ensete ventricosum]|nr:hypothetical protein GW17_00009391 [Ensete ventricosum]
MPKPPTWTVHPDDPSEVFKIHALSPSGGIGWGSTHQSDGRTAIDGATVSGWERWRGGMRTITSGRSCASHVIFGAKEEVKKKKKLEGEEEDRRRRAIVVSRALIRDHMNHHCDGDGDC